MNNPQRKQDEVVISAVLTSDIPVMWPLVEPLLEPAVDRSQGRWTKQDAFESLAMGIQQLWIAYMGERVICAWTTLPTYYPSKKMLGIQFLGGSEVEHYMDEGMERVLRYAKESGFDGVEVIGRPGLKKIVGPHGLEPKYVTYDLHFERNET